jgi:hypothetical protein
MGDLRAPIGQAHQSAALTHLANISLRSGASLPLEKLRAAVPNNENLHDIIDRQQLQLSEWKVDLKTTSCSLGSELTIDPKTEALVGPDHARKFYQPEYRSGFVVPEIS